MESPLQLHEMDALLWWLIDIKHDCCLKAGFLGLFKELLTIMSKQQGKISNESDAAAVVDPQSLFQQFAPTLYFEKPKTSPRADWYVIAEQVVPATRDAFWETIVN